MTHKQLKCPHVKLASRIIAVFVCILVLQSPASAGGYRVNGVTINGNRLSERDIVTVRTGEVIEICADISGYSFSGAGDDRIGVLLRLQPPGAREPILKALQPGGTADRGGMQSSQQCMSMVAPREEGRFGISYNRVPIFSEFDRPSGSWVRLGELRVSLGTSTGGLERPFKLYLQMNGKIPGFNTDAEGGYFEQPLLFSWFIRPSNPGTNAALPIVEFRYRLAPPGLPEEATEKVPEYRWSQWQHTREAPFYFILPGRHVFEVEARYPDDAHTLRSGGIARYEFSLAKAFVAKPDGNQLTKGPKGFAAGPSTVPPRRIATSDIYTGSRAFLVGVTQYDDPRFLPLDFVSHDLDAFERTLKAIGFEVTRLQSSPSRTELLSELERFVTGVKPDERVILYFSMHGFQDRDVGTRAFLAPRDCKAETPETFCIPLAHLKQLTEKIQSRGARHSLIILDSCSAGLGVLEKSIAGDYFEQEIARARGSHMITAGLANQTARMDLNDIKMSYFTHFLVEGLKGKADLTKDGVVSASELLVYVRGEVARISNGDQTPMLGRIDGSGEMVFPLN